MHCEFYFTVQRKQSRFIIGKESFTLVTTKFNHRKVNFHPINIKFEIMNKCLIYARLTAIGVFEESYTSTELFNCPNN